MSFRKDHEDICAYPHHTSRPISSSVEPVSSFRWSCGGQFRLTMAKCVSIGFIVVCFIVLTIIAIQAETQGPDRAKTRSKLSGALRKKKNLRTTLEPDIVSSSTILSSSLNEETVTLEPASEDVVVSDSSSTTVSASTEEVTTTASRKRQHSGRTASPPRPRNNAVDCGECDQEDCNVPPDNSCPTGLVLDRCGCCYVCGAIEGNRCYNSTLNLPYNPDIGVCGPHLDCLLRNDDLDLTEPREALCECRDKRIVCGSDHQTYLSECKLREAAHAKPGLTVTAYSPCVTIPVITTAVENVTASIGEDVSLSCEVRGYPAPVLHWEFLGEGASGNPQILPGDDSEVVIVVRGGPEQIMTTTWIQIIGVNQRRQGSYHCVAKNTEGMTHSVALIKVTKNDGEDE